VISVCYTSARPALVPGQVREWLANAHDADSVEFVVTIDAASAEHHDALAGLPRTRVFVNPGRPCCVDGWNLAARKARGDILIQCSDDLHPPARWDADIRVKLANGDTIGALAVSDGCTASIDFLPHAILTRRYYNQFGYLFHDAYWSMWSDNEFSAVAHSKNAVIDGREIRFTHSHGQVHDEVRARHEQSYEPARSLFLSRQQQAFRPWHFEHFLGDDGDSDGIYSPNWHSRPIIYWNRSPKSSDQYLALHRESNRRRAQMFGPRPQIDEFQVLVPTIPQRREFLDVLTAELTRQGISFLLDERIDVSVGEKRNQLIARATAPYVTFVDDDDWVSHNYGELILDAIRNNGHQMDVILYDVVTTVDDDMPRGSYLSFELGNDNLPDCFLRLPNHLMVWRRAVAAAESFPTVSRGEDSDWAARMRRHVSRWARIHALLYFYEFLWSRTATQK
jgi:hypothetical protein